MPDAELPARRTHEISGAYSFEAGWRGLALTPDGDAFRLLEKHHDRLLVAERPGDYPDLLVLDPTSGLWSSDPAEFLALHQRTVNDYAIKIAHLGPIDRIRGVSTPSQVAKAVRDCLLRKRLVDAEQCRKSVGSIISQLGEASEQPWWAIELNRCRLDEIDGDLNSIAAPNGVVDLRTGRLLPPAEGKRRLMTRQNMLPDPYRQDASHPDVERLLAHIDPTHADYFWQEIAYCLLGQPSRRILFLVGDQKGGKTTLLNAITNSLGSGLVTKATAQSITRSKYNSRSANDPYARYFVSPARIATIEEAADVVADVEIAKERSGDAAFITYSEKYRNPVSLRPTATMLFVANHAPKHFGLNDPAMYDRCKVLPYVPVPLELRDPKVRPLWSDTTDASRPQRQALVALLVRLASVFTPGQPPTPPAGLSNALDDWATDEIGEAGQWLRLNLAEDSSSFVSIEDVWIAWKQEVGADNRGLVNGISRPGFAAYARGIVRGLPKASRPRSHGLKWGWRGWRLLDDDDLPFVEHQELGLDVGDSPV